MLKDESESDSRVENTKDHSRPRAPNFPLTNQNRRFFRHYNYSTNQNGEKLKKPINKQNAQEVVQLLLTCDVS